MADTYIQKMPRSIYLPDMGDKRDQPGDITTQWINVTEFNKHERGEEEVQYKPVAQSTLVSRLKHFYRRSCWYITDDSSDKAMDMTNTVSGVHTIAGHISRSHSTTVWDFVGIRSAVFHSSVAQERAGHTKQTFLNNYSRILPHTFIMRWESHPQNIFLSPDEVVFC